MAVTTTKLPNTTIGITYSVITDSSSDWTSVSNDVYFFDKATDLPYYKNASGTVVSLFESGGGGGTTNLSIGSKTSTTLDIVSSDGTDATVPAVTTSEAGLSSAADKTKLNGIESGADVTDTTNVTSAGALMDSEVTNLAQVKAFDSSDYATSAQGTLATNALPKSGGAMTGAITTNSTFDGRDVATDGTKLDGIEASADVTDTANVTSAGALMDSEVTDLSGIKSVTISTLQVKPSEGAFANGDKTKLDGIEASADVTDTANVTSAGALMDSEVTDLSGIKSVTISTLQVKPSEGAFANGDKTKLDGIEASATIDQTDAEIETAYNNQVAVATQAEAEAGTLTDVKRFTPQRVKQAIDALSGGGSGNAVTMSVQKDSSGTINKGQVVMLADYDVGADLTTVELADNSAGSTMPGIGIATSSIAQATTGTIVIFGKATGLNTSALSLGDVYVGTSGNCN